MLNVRLQAALKVRDAYMPLKRASDDLAAQATRCVLVMQEERKISGLKLGMGADAIADVSRGAALIAQGLAAIAEAHPKLASLIEDAGLARHYPYQTMYGDDATVPNSASAGGDQPRLSVVAS